MTIIKKMTYILRHTARNDRSTQTNDFLHRFHILLSIDLSLFSYYLAIKMILTILSCYLRV